MSKKKSKLNEQLHQVDENDLSFEENITENDNDNDIFESKIKSSAFDILNHIQNSDGRKSTSKNLHQTKISRESNKVKNISIENTDLIHKRKMSNVSSRSNKSNDTLKEYLNVSNFSTDDLIYWILINSLEKLEAFGNNLVEEAYLLKDMYMKISEDERSDFFRRIHSLEISTQVIFQEVVIKKKFLKYSKSQFKNYNKVSNNFYFKSSFNFFIELMISKVTQLEIVIDKLQSIVRMIKENYLITIEDNTHMQNIKLNMVMKVLAIITTIYAPFDIVAALFGMNVPIPFQHSESLWPFFGIIGFLILIFIIQMVLFKRLGWF
jgi:Mg2+ and Co2+ transporter CorA